MDHPFITRRVELKSAIECKDLIVDIRTIASANEHDLKCIMRRCEPDIQNESLKHTIMRHVSGLGCLVSEVERLCSILNVTFLQTAMDKVSDAWSSFITQGKSFVENGVLKTIMMDVEARISDYKAIEHDDDVSSTSDYSDSYSESDSGERDHVDHEEDESSDDDDEEGCDGEGSGEEGSGEEGSDEEGSGGDEEGEERGEKDEESKEEQTKEEQTKEEQKKEKNRKRRRNGL